MKRILNVFIILILASTLFACSSLLEKPKNNSLEPYENSGPYGNENNGSSDGSVSGADSGDSAADGACQSDKDSDSDLTETGLDIPVIKVSSDQDGDGISDLEDIVEGARADAENKPRYKDAYYSGGYPPDDEGVCTDVLWRSFKNAGYSLKDMIDEDIRNHTDLYPRVGGRPDPNIDFRRIQNLIVFFNRYAEVLTTELIPGDEENLVQWQGGDIIVFIEPYEHTGILSDLRNEEGVPYLIHNGGPYTKEEDILPWFLSQGYEIAWHFRFPKEPEQ